MKEWLRIALQRRIAMNSTIIALVVGTLLNAINEGQGLLNNLLGADGDVAWGHVLANYAIPYGVATFSAIKNELDRKKNSG